MVTGSNNSAARAELARKKSIRYYNRCMAPLLAAIIMTNTSSYSSTGGNTVGTGGTVSNGSSESSAYSENYVGSSDSNGSSATVHIETDNNGVVQQQTITKTAPPGQSLDIEVGTSSGRGSVNVYSYIHSGSGNGAGATHGRPPHNTNTASSSATTTLSLEANTTLQLPKMDFGGQLKAFFMHLFSLFGL